MFDVDTTAVRHYLEAKLPFYLDLLRQMVAINSFTTNSSGVEQLARLTADLFRNLDLDAELVPSVHLAYGPHLVLTRAGESKRTVGLISHLDTVFPPQEERQNDFHWREDGDLIYGPGTVDIKGGTVLIYMVLDALRCCAPELFDTTTWVVLLDAAEETDGEEFARLCRARLPRPETRAALIFEGGRGSWQEANVVVARKGRAIYQVTAEGRAAHAGSSHEQGANAIVQLAALVRQIDSFTDYGRDLTFNVGTLTGGSVVNRVPHFASASVEMRAFAEEVFREGMQRMLALPRTTGQVKSANGDFRCRVRVDVEKETRPWPRNPRTDRLLQIWQEAGRGLGMQVFPEERGGLSDGNYFWEAIPTLDGLGPAGGNAHCSERSADGQKEPEFVRRDSFVPKALLNVLAICRLLAQ